jgi:ribosome-binding protein aMBF1 (putative translation factor)
MNSPRKHTSSIRQRLANSGDKIRRARLPKRMRLAFKIADGIDALDWDNKDLADKLGKYSSVISRWLKGNHNFTVDTLSDIEEILGIKLLALDDYTEDKGIVGTFKCTLEFKLKGKEEEDMISAISDAGGMQVSSTEFEFSK